jgi:hypothetical protein
MWPYGIVAAIDEGAIAITCIITIVTYLNLKNNLMISMMKLSWAYFMVSSLGFLGMSLQIIAQNYPAYWFDNIRSDFWTYYIRFWLSAVLFILVFSVQVLRLAGGIGWESEDMAKRILLETLSEEVVDKRRDSLDDLLGAGDSKVEKIGDQTPISEKSSNA